LGEHGGGGGKKKRDGRRLASRGDEVKISKNGGGVGERTKVESNLIRQFPSLLNQKKKWEVPKTPAQRISRKKKRTRMNILLTRTAEGDFDEGNPVLVKSEDRYGVKGVPGEKTQHAQADAAIGDSGLQKTSYWDGRSKERKFIKERERKRPQHT